jgi:tetratricopeptide (TPR) repeat protein
MYGALILASVSLNPNHEANAQPRDDDWLRCRDTENLTATDQNLAACGKILADVTLSKQDRAAALTNRCRLWLVKQNPDRAVADCIEAVSLNPNSAVAYANLGNAHVRVGATDLALSDYSRAISLDPKISGPYANRSRIYRARGELDRAVADLNEAIRLLPNVPGNYRERGTIELSNGDFAAAADDFKRALDLTKALATDWVASYNIISLYIARARHGEDALPELKAYRAQITHHSWPLPVIEMFLGVRTPESILSAAAAPSDRCEAQFYVGEWYLLHTHPSEARIQFTAAVELCPKDYGEYLVANSELRRLSR